MFWCILCVWRGWPGTRIFSPLTIARLCVTIGHYWYLFNRLTAVSAGRFYRFEHILSYSSGKVVAKSADSARLPMFPGLLFVQESANILTVEDQQLFQY